MHFTNNIVIVELLLFFTLYFIFFVLPQTKKMHLSIESKNHFIALASLLFYASWYPPAILLLLYHALLGKYSTKYLKREKKNLWFVIFLALIPLLFFKYYNYFIELVALQGASLDLILPLGLSFYTFSMIGYYIDIYNKEVEANQSFLDILLFIAFWPHLAAGPILRAKNIFGNIFKEEPLTVTTVTLALLLIIVGLVKKLLIADNIGAYVNWNISYGVESMSIVDAWATMLGFSAQIYADFSGYSDMAIGFALLMGFRLPANFNYPYLATTITEFWHRWHISLSTWFRDYLYFPLGGSKEGNYRTYMNIMIVFILSGIWHGAGVGFALWGAIHGIILVVEKALGREYLRVSSTIRWLITMMLIVIAWSFFRLEYSDAIMIVQKMFGFENSLFINHSSPYYQLVIFMMLFYPLLDHIFKFYQVNKEGYPVINNNRIGFIVLSVLILLAFTFSGDPLPFIYFDF